MEAQVAVQQKQQIIQEIIGHALDELNDWKPPTPRPSIGPTYPEVFKVFSAQLSTLRTDIWKRLSGCGIDELRRDFPPSTTPYFNLLFNLHGLHYDLAGRLANLKNTVPANYIGGWATLETEIDLEHWRGREQFSLRDATLLVVGRDPRGTNFNHVFDDYGKSKEGDEALYFLEDLYDRIAAGFRLDPEDQDAKIGSRDFFDWAQRHHVKIDPRFRRMLKEQFKSGSVPPELTSSVRVEKDIRLHGSTKTVLTRVILAVAIKKYGLDDARKLAKVARAMQDDGDFCGISFDSETVRKLLLAGWNDYTRVGPK